MDIRHILLDRAKRLAGFPGQDLPAATGELMERARAIAEGTICFYGREPVRIGLKDIDWSGAHILHQEWPAQLNRFFYLTPLAAAYAKTGDERFARAARAYLEDWISRGSYEDPAAPLRPGDNTLSIAVRLGDSIHPGWGGALPAFLASDAFDDDFLRRIVESMERQAVFLSRHLHSRGNWRIAHLDAIVFTALRLPFLKSSKRLLALGIRGMRAGLATQFLPDGVHVERTPGYHGWMANVAWSYLRLARTFPEADARVDAEHLARAFDYQAQGALSGINDARTAISEPKEMFGLDARSQMLRFAGLEKRFGRKPPLAQVFPDAGQVFARSAWRPGADYLAFDASTWGGGHSHLGRLSFTFRSGGRLLVADPGTVSYEMSDPSAIYGKSTPAHSTLNLNGLSQSECDAKFLAAEFTRDVALLHAKYEGGYWSGPFGWRWRSGHGTGTFGAHERVLLWIRNEYLLVLDRMEADDPAEVRNVFQMGPMDGWRMDARRLAWWSTNRGMNLHVQLLSSPAGARMQCREGSRRPIRGWIGGDTGLSSSTPAPRVEFAYPAAPGPMGAVSAALLVPFRGSRRPRIRLLSSTAHADGWIRSLELGLPGGRRDFIAWSWHLELPIELEGEGESAAPFIWRRRDARGKILKSFSPGAGAVR